VPFAGAKGQTLANVSELQRCVCTSPNVFTACYFKQNSVKEPLRDIKYRPS
jgi:hypothetical protein